MSELENGTHMEEKLNFLDLVGKRFRDGGEIEISSFSDGHVNLTVNDEKTESFWRISQFWTTFKEEVSVRWEAERTVTIKGTYMSIFRQNKNNIQIDDLDINLYSTD